MTQSARPAVAVLAAILLWGSLVSAQPSTPEQKEALARYKEGSAHYNARRYEEAVVSLSQSLHLFASPNAALVLGHAYRDSGKPVEAMGVYELADALARERVDGGANEYKGTLDEAKKWQNTLKGQLGELSIQAPASAPVTINGSPAEAKSTTDNQKTYHVWQKPGAVTVVATIDGKAIEEKRVLEAGKAAPAITFTAPKVVETPSPVVPVEPEKGLGLVIPGIVVGGVGLVGMGLFIGFGLKAKSAHDELAECTPSCPKSLRPVAEDGEQAQLIANISLGVGGGALATGAILIIVELATGGAEHPAPVSVAPIIDLVPGGLASGLAVAGRF